MLEIDAVLHLGSSSAVNFVAQLTLHCSMKILFLYKAYLLRYTINDDNTAVRCVSNCKKARVRVRFFLWSFFLCLSCLFSFACLMVSWTHSLALGFRTGRVRVSFFLISNFFSLAYLLFFDFLSFYCFFLLIFTLLFSFCLDCDPTIESLWNIDEQWTMFFVATSSWIAAVSDCQVTVFASFFEVTCYLFLNTFDAKLASCSAFL